jgi:hypothetical protein
MEVRNGVLLNVLGLPVRRGGIAIMAAEIELKGDFRNVDHRLCDQLGFRQLSVIGSAVERGMDAAFVRARIPRAFGFSPGASDAEKSLLDAGFVAFIESESVCYPFVCTDHYGRSALMFSGDGPDEVVRKLIADAFWGILAENPDDLSDFEERVYHSGAMVWLTFGCSHGELYCEESSG